MKSDRRHGRTCTTCGLHTQQQQVKLEDIVISPIQFSNSGGGRSVQELCGTNKVAKANTTTFLYVAILTACITAYTILVFNVKDHLLFTCNNTIIDYIFLLINKYLGKYSNFNPGEF